VPAILAVSLFHSARMFYVRRDATDLVLAAVTACALALFVFLLMIGYLADLFWEPFG
jgi:hypothetical protein